jgi:hypothetical protein
MGKMENTLERRWVRLVCDVCGMNEERVLDVAPNLNPVWDTGWERQWREIPELPRARGSLLVCSEACLAQRLERLTLDYYRPAPVEA